MRETNPELLKGEVMKERGILFNGEMVKAILEGRKTQTRRVVKNKIAYCRLSGSDVPEDVMFDKNLVPIQRSEWKKYCPYGQPGDRLYVRETWREPEDHEGYERGSVLYAAAEMDAEAKWKPSIHMPRWASRITLEITNVRVERLQTLSLEEMIKEGVKPYSYLGAELRGRYVRLWNSTTKTYQWNSNPWVWVIEFKKINLKGERHDR